VERHLYCDVDVVLVVLVVLVVVLLVLVVVLAALGLDVQRPSGRRKT